MADTKLLEKVLSLQDKFASLQEQLSSPDVVAPVTRRCFYSDPAGGQHAHSLLYFHKHSVKHSIHPVPPSSGVSCSSQVIVFIQLSLIVKLTIIKIAPRPCNVNRIIVNKTKIFLGDILTAMLWLTEMITNWGERAWTLQQIRERTADWHWKNT